MRDAGGCREARCAGDRVQHGVDAVARRYPRARERAGGGHGAGDQAGGRADEDGCDRNTGDAGHRAAGLSRRSRAAVRGGQDRDPAWVCGAGRYRRARGARAGDRPGAGGVRGEADVRSAGRAADRYRRAGVHALPADPRGDCGGVSPWRQADRHGTSPCVFSLFVVGVLS